jgi:polyisoprenoid-binding protein YceI
MKTVKSIFASLLVLAAMAFSFNLPNGTLNVDVANSKVVWTGKKVTGSHTGAINISKGSLEVKKERLVGGSFEIDMNTITCTDLTGEWNGKLVGHLKSDDFFGVEKFPTAKFEITKTEDKGNGDYQIKGKITIKGTTQEIEFPAKVEVKSDKVTATAKVTIDRTKFNVKYGSGAFFTDLGDKMIYDNFELDITLVSNVKS